MIDHTVTALRICASDAISASKPVLSAADYSWLWVRSTADPTMIRLEISAALLKSLISGADLELTIPATDLITACCRATLIPDQ